MNKIDTLYFEAIMAAHEGAPVAHDAITAIAAQAAKFAAIGEPEEAARFYERLFQLRKALIESKQTQYSTQLTELDPVLRDYIDLLATMGRDERACTVRMVLEEVTCSNSGHLPIEA